MQLCFFSDVKGQRFDPLTLTRPVEDLRVGILTVQDKWERWLHLTTKARICRPYLTPLYSNSTIEPNHDCLWINARFLPDHSLTEQLKSLLSGQALTYSTAQHDGAVAESTELVAVVLSGQQSLDCLLKCKHINNPAHWVQTLLNASESSKKYTGKAKKLDYLWDILQFNSSEIEADLELISLPTVEEHDLRTNLHVMHPERIFVHPSAHLEPGVILVAEDGPIYIGAGATIEAGSILKGPLAVCEGAVTKMGCRIYGGTTIGPVSKVGGEVSNTIFHSYSNKAHDGYMGNSLVGQWCNMGADSNTSNLKTNYGLIYLEDWNSRQAYDIGFQFFGSVLGDHSKTAINAMLNTGTMCGVCSNIFLSQFTPKHIPSFSWLTDTGNSIYRFDKAVEAMQAMMARRDIEFEPGYQRMMKHLFDQAIEIDHV